MSSFPNKEWKTLLFTASSTRIGWCRLLKLLKVPKTTEYVDLTILFAPRAGSDEVAGPPVRVYFDA